jgi:lipid II:glycine glycyltransferase (peptidoglycan interpeptide bridge formation enzyme)
VAVAMLAELRRYWTVERGMYLRVLPTLFQGEVEPHLLTGSGYHLVEGSAVWVSSLVDLSQPIEVLRRRLQQKWRNCLNKAERQEVVAESGSSDAAFTEVLLEYEQRLKQKTFTSVVTPDLLTRLQSHLPEDRKLWALLGRQDNRTLGGILIARYGQTSEYLVGAVSDAGKAANAGQYLLWRAICEMKEMGYRWFDLGGMDPLRTRKGILHFKQGVNGSPYGLIGELEAFDGGLLSQVVRWRVGRARQAS